MIRFIRKTLGSRKAWAVALSSSGAVANTLLEIGVPRDVVLAVLGVVCFYVLGQGIADRGTEQGPDLPRLRK